MLTASYFDYPEERLADVTREISQL